VVDVKLVTYVKSFTRYFQNIWNGTLEEDFEKIALIEVTLVRGKLTFPGMPKPPVNNFTSNVQTKYFLMIFVSLNTNI